MSIPMSMFRKLENQCQYQCQFYNFREINVNANVNTSKIVNINTCFNTIAHVCSTLCSKCTRDGRKGFSEFTTQTAIYSIPPLPEYKLIDLFPPQVWITAKLFQAMFVSKSLAVIQNIGGKKFSELRFVNGQWTQVCCKIIFEK